MDGWGWDLGVLSDTLVVIPIFGGVGNVWKCLNYRNPDEQESVKGHRFWRAGLYWEVLLLSLSLLFVVCLFVVCCLLFVVCCGCCCEVVIFHKTWWRELPYQRLGGAQLRFRVWRWPPWPPFLHHLDLLVFQKFFPRVKHHQCNRIYGWKRWTNLDWWNDCVAPGLLVTERAGWGNSSRMLCKTLVHIHLLLKISYGYAIYAMHCHRTRGSRFVALKF